MRLCRISSLRNNHLDIMRRKPIRYIFQTMLLLLCASCAITGDTFYRPLENSVAKYAKMRGAGVVATGVNLELVLDEPSARQLFEKLEALPLFADSCSGNNSALQLANSYKNIAQIYSDKKFTFCLRNTDIKTVLHSLKESANSESGMCAGDEFCIFGKTVSVYSETRKSLNEWPTSEADKKYTQSPLVPTFLVNPYLNFMIKGPDGVSVKYEKQKQNCFAELTGYGEICTRSLYQCKNGFAFIKSMQTYGRGNADKILHTAIFRNYIAYKDVYLPTILADICGVYDKKFKIRITVIESFKSENLSDNIFKISQKNRQH